MTGLTRTAVWRGVALAGLVALAGCETQPQKNDVPPPPAVTASAQAQRQQPVQQQPQQQQVQQAAPQQQAVQQQPSQQPQQQQSPQQPQAANSTPVVAMYMAQTNPANGLVRIQLHQTTSVYALARPVFTEADMQQIVPVQGQNGQVFLRFDFNPQGAAKLAQVTRQAVGNYLLVSVRGRFVAVPRIGSPYTDGKLPIPVKNADEARSVVQLLRQPPAAK